MESEVQEEFSHHQSDQKKKTRTSTKNLGISEQDLRIWQTYNDIGDLNQRVFFYHIEQEK